MFLKNKFLNGKINSFYLKFIDRFYFSEKFYKVTFSGLDKFLSNDEFRHLILQLNEIKIFRTHKSTNKNYAHIDLSSALTNNGIKEKFEAIKISGKSIKVRVKEIDEETKEILGKTYNNLNFDDINNEDYDNSKNIIKQFIKQYYIKNLSDNPFHIKNILETIEINTDWLSIQEYNREIFEFEYKLQILNDFNSKKMTKKDLLNNPTFLPIRSFSEFPKDPKYSKVDNIIKEIFTKLEEIFIKLKYPSYDVKANKGVFRNLQVKYIDNHENDPKLIFTLMISMAQLTETDIKIICEAINFELKNYINNVSFYLSINEKVQGLVHNSHAFYHVFGNFKNFNFNVNNSHAIRIFPFNNDTYPSYLKNINLEELFNQEKIKFSDIIELDFSQNFTPIGILIKTDLYDNLNYFRDIYEFGLYDIKSKTNLLEEMEIKHNSLITLNTNFKKLKVHGKINDIHKGIDSNFVNNLMVINLRNLSSKKIKFEKVLETANYHILISPSLLQILDFLKNYPIVPKMCKIIFVKDIKYEIKEVVMAFKLII